MTQRRRNRHRKRHLDVGAHGDPDQPDAGGVHAVRHPGDRRHRRHLAARRDESVLSTQVGYGIEGERDWTRSCIVAGIEAALRRMQTDWIDIVHLHSCPWTTLAEGDVITALEAAK